MKICKHGKVANFEKQYFTIDRPDLYQTDF